VQDAIYSVVNQDYPNKRLVVVNDASTDNSWEKIISLIKDKKVIPDIVPEIHHGNILGVPIIAANFPKNVGRSEARNYGIRTGLQDTQLYSFLDSDDYYKQGKLSRSVEEWLKSPQSIGVIYTDYTILNIHNNLEQRQFKEPFSFQRLREECIINNDSVISKVAIEKCGMYDPSLDVVEDFDLWLRITKHFTCIHIAENLLTVRVGRHSSTDTIPKETWEKCYRKVMEKNQ
jgi:glycosyltransferase involved in cell wall biosynthesis